MTAAPDPPLELLLSDARERLPVLERGLPTAALAAASAPVEPRGAASLGLDGPDRDPNLLDIQRWAVVAPEGPEGDRMLAAISGLVRHREAEQGAPVKLLRAPPGLDLAGAMRWRDRFLRHESILEFERPRYLLLLGDLQQLSLETQYILAHGAFVGRLALPDLDAYAAYAAKVVRWETTSREAPRMLAYTAQDGTSATSAGYRHLVQPCVDMAQKWTAAGKLKLDAAVTVPHEDDGPHALLAEAAASEASLLLSLSHGLGAPKDGWATPEAQRRLQGALCIGLDSDPLTAEMLAGKPFLPGGVWFLVACFGAGTPATSAYQPWLAALAERGGDAAAAREVLRSLPRPGEPPFLAALPQAALASPLGPLAVIGHIDLAWTFAFTDDGRTSRASRIFNALRPLLSGSRVGVALDVLMQAYRDTNDNLTNQYQAQREAMMSGKSDPPDPVKLANMWMRRNDLRGYVLLGDPAAYLPLARANARYGEPGPPSIIDFRGPRAAAPAPAPQDSSPADPPPDPPTTQDAAPASFSAPAPDDLPAPVRPARGSTPVPQDSPPAPVAWDSQPRPATPVPDPVVADRDSRSRPAAPVPDPVVADQDSRSRPAAPVPQDSAARSPRVAADADTLPPEPPARPAAPRPARAAPVPEDRLRKPPRNPLDADDAPAPARPPPRSMIPRPADAARRRERAVLALLRGDETPRAIATRLGLDLDDLFDWLERYRQSGRRSLDED